MSIAYISELSDYTDDARRVVAPSTLYNSDLSKSILIDIDQRTGQFYITDRSGSSALLYIPLPGQSISIYANSGGFSFDYSDRIGNTQIRGGDFGDVIRGGLGDDLIAGGAGADTLFGGSGVDTVSYASSLSGVTVNLAAGTGFGGDAAGDLISGFENLTGSAFGDDLTGDDVANLIIGGGGYDVVRAAGGDDRVVLTGMGEVDGGDGYDILALDSGPYAFAGATVVNVEQVNLRDGVAADFSGLSATPGLFVSFSAPGGGVSLTATDFGETIRLGDGADILDAGAGDDRIFVYAGGSATIDGGEGADRLFVQSGLHVFTDDTLQNVEIVTVRAGAYLGLGDMTGGMKIVSTSAVGANASIVGTSGDDVIRLGNGGDLVMGGAGDDRLFGGAGADSFYFNETGFGRDQVFADLVADRIELAGVANSLDDLNFRTAANGLDVVVTIDGLDAKTNAIFLKNVTIEEVRAAEDGFFAF